MSIGSLREGQLLSCHGGNLDAVKGLFPNAKTPWLDLSTGINTISYPIPELPKSVWCNLPTTAEQTHLELAARYAYGAPDCTEVVGAPGTQALIQLLPRLFPAKQVGILNFTYTEHQICWQAAGASVSSVADLQTLKSFETAIVVNPNNPDGRIAHPEALVDLAKELASSGGRLFVDEAFMDLEWQKSVIPSLPAAGAMVLRSFGKTYGLGGLRLGFAVGSTGDCARLRQALGPWSISGPAIEIGRRALADKLWLAQAAQRLHGDSMRLDRVLQNAGFDILGGTLLFRLTSHRAAESVFTRLCEFGILVRRYVERPNFLRFGIPHYESDWQRLIGALASC
jgi:cobalamin biosynthesis protein CobC